MFKNNIFLLFMDTQYLVILEQLNKQSFSKGIWMIVFDIF